MRPVINGGPDQALAGSVTHYFTTCLISYIYIEYYVWARSSIEMDFCERAYLQKLLSVNKLTHNNVFLKINKY